MITIKCHGPNDSTFCALQHEFTVAFTSYPHEKLADGTCVAMFQVGSAGSKISPIPIASYNVPWNLSEVSIDTSDAPWKLRMAEIFCQIVSDAPTESPPCDIQIHPSPGKSITYLPKLFIARFSGISLDVISIIPPVGITFGQLGCLANPPKISEIS